MKLILRIVIVALVIFAIPKFIPGFLVNGFIPALIAAVALGIVNVTIKPLIGLITLPINIFTLGLFGLMINAVLFWLIAVFVPGFAITSLVAAFIGAVIVSFANWIASHI